MQVQFSPIVEPPAQPSSKSSKPIKGLPFEIIRDNLINIAKFEKGKWPVINKDKQLIEVEEGPTPEQMTAPERSVRWMKRKLFGAFEPDFVDEIFRSAICIIRQNKRNPNTETASGASLITSLFKPALDGLQHLTMTYFDKEKNAYKKLDKIWGYYTKFNECELKSLVVKKEARTSEGKEEGFSKSATQDSMRKCNAIPPASVSCDLQQQLAKVLESNIPAASISEQPPSEQLTIATSRKNVVSELRQVKAFLLVSVDTKANSIVNNKETLDSKGSVQNLPVEVKQTNYRAIEKKPLPSEGKSPADLLAEAMKKRRAAMLIDIDPEPKKIDKPIVVVQIKNVVNNASATRKYPAISPEKIKQYEEANKKFHAEMLAKMKNAVLKKPVPAPETPKTVGKLTKIQCGFAQFFNLGMLGRSKAEQTPAQDIAHEWVDLSECSKEKGNAVECCAIGASREAPEQVSQPGTKVQARRATSELYDRKYMQGLMDNMLAELDQSA